MHRTCTGLCQYTERRDRVNCRWKLLISLYDHGTDVNAWDMGQFYAITYGVVRGSTGSHLPPY